MTLKVTRREFLVQSGSFAGVAAMGPLKGTLNRLIPYVIPPDNIRPGTWAMYATTCRECPAGCGMLLRHRDGRVVKAEGNPAHPLNRGGLCARGQSCVQELYDPDRLQGLRCRSEGGACSAGWTAALNFVAGLLSEKDRRVSVLSRLQTGAFAEVLSAFGRAFGTDRVLFYEPVTYDAQKRAHALLFGRADIPDYRLDQADFVLSLGADFLDTWLAPVLFANRFADFHSVHDGTLGRMVYAGPSLSLTAGNADEFIRTAPGDEWRIGAAVLNTLLTRGWIRQDAGAIAGAVKRLGWTAVGPPPGVSETRVRAWAMACREARAPLVFGGHSCSAAPSAINAALAAALLNAASGQLGRTMDFSRTWAIGQAAEQADVTRFLEGLDGKDVLIVIDANPAYARPACVEQLRKAGTLIYLGTHVDETAELADRVFPIDSPLEDWGDYEALTGVQGLVQPGLRPLHDTRSAGDILLSVARAAGRPLEGPGGRTPPDFRAWVSMRWQGLLAASSGGLPLTDHWTEALRRGGLWLDTGRAEPVIRVREDFETSPLTIASPPSMGERRLQLWVRPSVMFYDGRVANRGWLQEAPDPVSTLVWGSSADMHPRTASRLGLAPGQWVTIQGERESLQAPVRLTEDAVEEAVILLLGQGHTALGAQAKGSGVNAFRLLVDRPVGGPFGTVTVSPAANAGAPVYLSASQNQFGRKIAQWTGWQVLRGMKPGDGDALALPLPEGYDPKRDLPPPHEHRNHRWAMAIDLQRCTGCGACAVACYAENNVAVMGREAVTRGREMAWLKVVPYRHPEEPDRIAWLPLMCQQCDAAPCEPVCPVFASVHSEEGLNQQVYNRCVGTRYCSNNCPYKVRRFNWLNVQWPPPLDLQLNPDVTVRCRGVMEKCTFCVQRIRGAELDAGRERRRMKDGDVQPACAESCPTGAIVFGDLLDPDSRVTRLTRTDPRRYHVLETLNTKPAVTYLRRIVRDGSG